MIKSLKRKRNDSDNLSVENLISEILTNLEIQNKCYYNHNQIVKDFITSLENNYEGSMNACLECGVDMGRSNPRQLCGKTFCYEKIE